MNKTKRVDEFLTNKNHPLTKEIDLIRTIILETDAKIEETIKWNAPTFMYNGNIASFFMNAKKFVSLMFHKGVLIKDDFDLLEGDGKEGRVARFNDIKDIENKKEALQSLIKEWILMMDKK
mgnify:CR=1 FL=1